MAHRNLKTQTLQNIFQSITIYSSTGAFLQAGIDEVFMIEDDSYPSGLVLHVIIERVPICGCIGDGDMARSAPR